MNSINPALSTKYPNLFGHLEANKKWHSIKFPVTVDGIEIGKNREWVLNSKTGELYNSDSKIEIFGKMVGIALIRIPMTIGKTFYHLALPLSLPCEIMDGLEETKGKPGLERFQHCMIKCARSLVDIVKTPLVGIALTVLFVAGAIFGPFLGSTGFLFEIRGAISTLLHFLWWNEKIPFFPVETTCMSSKKLLEEEENVAFTAIAGFKYPEEYNDNEKRLLHFAYTHVDRDWIQTRREKQKEPVQSTLYPANAAC